MALECRTVSVEEAGRIIGVSRNVVYEAARTGAIPAIRIGRLLRVPIASLEKLLGGPIANDEAGAAQGVA